MLVAFIDESGKATPKELTPFVVSALIVDDGLIPEIEHDVVKIKLNKLPGIDPKAEIHARDITHGKRAYRTYTQEQRKDLLDELYAYISDLDCVIISVVVLKNKCVKSPKDPKEAMVENEEIAFGLLIERLAMFMEKSKGYNMLVVIDETDVSHDRKVRDMIEEEITTGMYTSKISASSRILNRPLFLRSSDYAALQLADLVAYAVFKKQSNRPISSIFDFNIYYDQVAKKFDRCPDGRVEGCGLKIWEN